MSATKAINIRASKSDKEMLRRAAKVKGVSLSDLLRSAAVVEAHKVLSSSPPPAEAKDALTAS